MKMRLPLYAVLILLAAAVAGTFTLTYFAVESKYSRALDAFSDVTTASEDSQNQTITLTVVGMEVEYVAVEDVFLVTRVVQNSKADISGIKLGDIILQINLEDATLAKVTTITDGDMVTVMRDVDGVSERRDTIL